MGDHIQSPQGRQGESERKLWGFVSSFTENKMDGDKLSKLYAKLKANKAAPSGMSIHLFSPVQSVVCILTTHCFSPVPPVEFVLAYSFCQSLVVTLVFVCLLLHSPLHYLCFECIEKQACALQFVCKWPVIWPAQI